MTTKNFLLFQAGKNFGLGRTIPENVFKRTNLGKVLTVQSSDGDEYVGVVDQLRLLIVDYEDVQFSFIKNAYDNGFNVVCRYDNHILNTVAISESSIVFSTVYLLNHLNVIQTVVKVTPAGWSAEDVELAKQDDMDWVKDKLSNDIPDEFASVNRSITAEVSAREAAVSDEKNRAEGEESRIEEILNGVVYGLENFIVPYFNAEIDTLKTKVDSKRAVFYARDYEDDEGNPPTTMAEVREAYERGDDLKFIYNKSGTTYIIPFSAKFGNGFAFSGVTDRMELLKAFIVDDEWVKDARYLVDSEDFGVVQIDLEAIKGKISENASPTNKLIDKDYVDSSISQMVARYLTATADGQPFATHSALVRGVFYYNGVIVQPAKNDYVLVNADETKGGAVTRYVFSDRWNFQYIVNNSPFTASQLAAINSGATESKIQEIAKKANASDVTTALNGKADKSTTYTKTEVDNKVSPKADKTYVDNMLGNVEALLAAI